MQTNNKHYSNISCKKITRIEYYYKPMPLSLIACCPCSFDVLWPSTVCNVEILLIRGSAFKTLRKRDGTAVCFGSFSSIMFALYVANQFSGGIFHNTCKLSEISNESINVHPHFTYKLHLWLRIISFLGPIQYTQFEYYYP